MYSDYGRKVNFSTKNNDKTKGKFITYKNKIFTEREHMGYDNYCNLTCSRIIVLIETEDGSVHEVELGDMKFIV